MAFEDNVIVVSAQEDNFQKMFLQGYWSCVEISADRLEHLQYIAVYQAAPESAVTHYARIKQPIKPNASQAHKYDIIFAEAAKPIGPITKARRGVVQGRRYTTLSRLLKARTLDDLFD